MIEASLTLVAATWPILDANNAKCKCRSYIMDAMTTPKAQMRT